MDTVLLHESIHRNARISASRSGGPGGQNVNKVNTKITLRLRVRELDGLSEAEQERVQQVLAGRITSVGELVIAADEERSRQINRERAFSRAEVLIVGAARLPKHRKPTKPSRTVQEQRLRSKQIHSRKKSDRRYATDRGREE